MSISEDITKVSDSVSSYVKNTVNTNFTSKVKSCMKSAGLSDEQITKALEDLGDVITDIDLEEIKTSIKESSTEFYSQITEIAKGYQGTANSYNNSDQQKVVNDNYVVQDAEYGKIFPEPSPMMVSKTSIPSFPEANSELDADYPNTYGKIDDSCNWYKVNKKDGYVEFVHLSGSSFKIDKTGNASLHLKGALKVMVDKDFLLNVMKNMDLGVNGDFAEIISKSRESKVGTNNINKAGALFKVSAASIDLN